MKTKEKELPMQIGTTLTSDFQEDTWTFQMPEGFSVSAGEFAILSKEKYNALITALKGISLSMSAHPDYEDGSEFSDMVDRCDESLQDLLSEISPPTKPVTDKEIEKMKADSYAEGYTDGLLDD